MMELVDMLGLGSSSEKSRGSSPFFGIMHFFPNFDSVFLIIV